MGSLITENTEAYGGPEGQKHINILQNTTTLPITQKVGTTLRVSDWTEPDNATLFPVFNYMLLSCVPA